MTAVAALGELPAAGAFLDLTDPDLATVAKNLAGSGFVSAVVAPLLFTEAFHATVDVPEAVREAAEVSGLHLITAAILGTGDDMLEVVRQSMTLAGIGSQESVLLLSVGSSSTEANHAILDFAARLGRGRSAPVAAAFGTRDPRAEDVLRRLPEPQAIVPLFLSPGLLLEPLGMLARERGLRMAAPLGPLVAPLLVERYHRASALG